MLRSRFDGRLYVCAPPAPAAWTRTAALVAGILLAPASVGAAEPAFTDQTEAAGLTFVHSPLADTEGVPMHGGGTVGDFDNDGFPDLFVVGGGGTHDHLFINDQLGGFTEESAAWGLTDLYRGNGAIAGDFDNDGWTDVFVTSFGDLPGTNQPGQHRLYRNNGDGSFTNVAAQAGVDFTWDIPDGMGATFGDYDLDGDLDLFVGGWFPRAPHLSVYEGTRLFRNNGDATFEDVTEAAGILDGRTRAFGAIFADMDGDRYPELLVAGDFGTSRYYVNNRDGTFTRTNVLLPGSDKVHNGMGTTVADVNRDGKLDWFVTSIFPSWFCEGPPGNRLYINESDGVGDHAIRAMPEGAGVDDGGWGWGAISFDFDHNGWVDLMHTGGWPLCFSEFHIDPPPGCPDECFRDEQSYLFQNNQDGTFADSTLAYGIEHALQGRGLVHFDYDRDGDMDVVVFANADTMKLYRNDLAADEDTHWLKVVLDSGGVPGLAPNGLGGNVRVEHDGGFQVHRITGGSNYLGRSELVAHFGVGRSTVIDEVNVVWPTGFRTVLTDVAADQELTVAAEQPLSAGPMVRGEDVTFTLTGLVPGESAAFLRSLTGLGAGPCREQFGGLCSDLIDPIAIGYGTADATGTATLTIPVPLGVPDEVYVQGVVARGEGGLRSLKSNPVTATVSDP